MSAATETTLRTDSVSRVWPLPAIPLATLLPTRILNSSISAPAAACGSAVAQLHRWTVGCRRLSWMDSGVIWTTPESVSSVSDRGRWLEQA